jgi:hypothetical protein
VCTEKSFAFGARPSDERSKFIICFAYTHAKAKEKTFKDQCLALLQRSFRRLQMQVEKIKKSQQFSHTIPIPINKLVENI